MSGGVGQPASRSKTWNGDAVRRGRRVSSREHDRYVVRLNRYERDTSLSSMPGRKLRVVLTLWLFGFANDVKCEPFNPIP